MVLILVPEAAKFSKQRGAILEKLFVAKKKKKMIIDPWCG